MTARVPPAAHALGFAGLLPQLLFTAESLWWPVGGWDGWALLAFAYPALILSFLGGMWWGFAMRRERGQWRLLALAVAPSLVALGLTGAMLLRYELRWPLVLLGSAVLLTLTVDRHLVRTGEAPEGWMALRVPLSLGLGALTIAAGALG